MPGPQVCIGSPDMSGYDIYQAMRVNVPGTQSLHNGASEWQNMNTQLQQAEQSLRSYQSSIAAGVQGASGDAAHQAAGPLLQANTQSQAASNSYHTQLTNQATQFDQRAGQLHDIAKNPPDAGFWNRAGSGWGLWGDDPQDKLNEYNKQAQENKMQFSLYTQDSYDHYQQMPEVSKDELKTFANVDVYDPSNASIKNHSNLESLGKVGSAGLPDGPGTHAPPNSGGGGNTGGTYHGGGGGGNPPSSGGGGGGNGGGGGFHPVSPVPPGTGGTSGTDPSGFGGYNPPTSGIGGATDPSGYARNSASDFGGIPPIGAGGFGGGFGEDGYGSGGRSGYGSGSLFGDEGFGGSGSALGGGSASGSGMGGAGGSGASAGGRGAGGSTGAGSRSGAGAFGEEGFGGRGGAAGGAGGRGGAGMGGAPMGGRGGKKEGDDEHQLASYLITEDNGNELVGDLPLTAPPVIGD